MLVLLLCMVCPQNGTAVVLKGLHYPPNKGHTARKGENQRNNTPPVIVYLCCCTAGTSNAHQAGFFFILDNNSGGGAEELGLCATADL